MENGAMDDALKLCKDLGIDSQNTFVYKQLKIENVRQIKDKSSLATYRKQAFVFGEIGFDAQNALLKMLEEHDGFRYFIFYKNDNLLDTIRSRAQIIRLHKKASADKQLLDAAKNGDIQNLIIKALSMQNMEKEDVISILETLSRDLSYKNSYDKAQIINERLLAFKKFRLNQKLFLFTLFFKLSGGV
jgi:DNA polymerase-3 subunit delta'